MRILIANSNTDGAFTERMVRLARDVIGPTTELVGASAPFGAAVIETPAQIETAAAATLAMFHAQPHDFDAGVVACFADPGLRRVQAAASFPVVGMAEASLLTALAVAPRVAVVTLGAASLPGLDRLIRDYGLSERVSALRALPVRPSEIGHDPAVWLEALQVEIDAAARTADAIVIGGAFLAGMARFLRAPVPLIDSLAAAVIQAEAAARIAAKGERSR